MQVYIHEYKKSFSVVTNKPTEGNFWLIDIPKGFEGFIIGVKNVDELLIYFLDQRPDTPVDFMLEIHDMEITLPVRLFWDRKNLHTQKAFDNCINYGKQEVTRDFNKKVKALGKANPQFKNIQLLHCEFVEFSSENVTNAIAYFLCIYSGSKLPEKF